MKKIGRNRNTYTSIDGLETVLNSSNYVEVSPLMPDSVGYVLSNPSSHDILVREQEFDNPDSTSDALSFLVFKRSVYESPSDTFPAGKISARSLSGAPTITVVRR